MKRKESPSIARPFTATIVGLAIAAVGLLEAGVTARAELPSVKKIYSATGVTGGFVVHLNCGDGKSTGTLRANDALVVQGLDRDAANVAKARASLVASGRNGPVLVEQLKGDRLPYIDNMVNLLVADDLDGISMAEINRVLVPNGVAYVKQGGEWKAVTKQRSKELDEWTHYFYSAKGNAVSHDTVVAPPERLQWVGSPRWSRHHDRMASMSAFVSAGGRNFYIMDEGSRVSILLPAKWSVIARDAFNGVNLWKLPIKQWHNQLWPLKSGPTQLARRLVAEKDRVYVTLGINAPITQHDAATGKTLQTYAATASTEEFVVADGVIHALLNPKKWVLKNYAPKHNTGDQKRVETEFNWDAEPRQLVAVETDSGKVLWTREDKVGPLTVASDGKNMVYYNGDQVVCLDAKNGKQNWASEPVKRRKLFEFNYAPRLVLYQNAVLYAGGDGAMKSFDAKSGKELWSAPHDRSGYRSPEDLLVAGGLVWSAPTTSGSMSGEFTGRDPFTGEVKKQFPPDVSTYWFHHRCYIAKATEKYLMPSRTGIEFVDHAKEHWDINHWVRGGCLYGVLPANGLTYAPPHNCACYPEAKLYGMNALSAGTASPHPKPFADNERLLKGPAYNQPINEATSPLDWPTFRHDATRSGYSNQKLSEDLGQAWEANLGGKLTATTIADGNVFVAKIDNHTLYALDATSGKTAWTFTPAGQVDSPPTYWKGRVFFGCADGRVYCLRASDGQLVWRYQAAPSERRLFAFEQLESVWPVHGSVLIENDQVSFVAGRSVFLDGGLRFIKLDAASGRKLVETIYDDKDPETGKDLQNRIQTLQMPVGLNDVLSSDGKFTYLRSQKIDEKGVRHDIGPISGNAATQGGTQQGEGAHIFAPMGFLDDTWFHRSYWVFGKNFAGGHNGYFQAGKFAPSGRILVFDDKNVYGYGRESKYLKWTTTLEHQLFSAPREAPKVPVPAPRAPKGKKKGKGKAAPAVAGPIVQFPNSERLNPANKELTIEAWVLPNAKNGVVLAHGGPLNGYAIVLEGSFPSFQVRSSSNLSAAQSKVALGEGWHHLVGVLSKDLEMKLYVDGKLTATGKASGLVTEQPKQTLELGGDSGSAVGDYPTGSTYQGMIDHVAIFHRALSAEEVAGHYLKPETLAAGKPVLFCPLDLGDARDESGGKQHGVASATDTGKGRVDNALWFKQKTAQRPAGKRAGKLPAGSQSGTAVQHDWKRYVPIVTRAMAMAGKTVIIAGPPDVVDEEYTFERLVEKDDKTVAPQLKEQDQALLGLRGGSLWTVDITTGQQSAGVELKSPPVWDGMAVAQGSLFVASMDGKVRRFGKAGDR